MYNLHRVFPCDYDMVTHTLNVMCMHACIITAVQAMPATTDMAVQVEPASPYELTSEDGELCNLCAKSILNLLLHAINCDSDTYL